MPISFLAALAISVAISVISTLLMPKPKQAKPDAAKELEEPVAEAGKPVNVVFGTVTVQSPNVLWFGDKSTRTYKVKV